MIPQNYPLFVRPVDGPDARDLLVVGWEKSPDGIRYEPVCIEPNPSVVGSAVPLVGDFRFAGIKVGSTR